MTLALRLLPLGGRLLLGFAPRGLGFLLTLLVVGGRLLLGRSSLLRNGL